MRARKLLIVDDDETLRSGLQAYLELEDYDVSTASSAEEAIRLELSQFDLILLDIMMGDMSGTDMVIKMKSTPTTRDIPIIFLTAKCSDEDMVEGLNLGADDYISKPYSISILLSRISAVLRRTAARPETSHGVTCNRMTLMCTVDNNPVKLPRKEFELLALLLENPGRIFTREELLSRIWPDSAVVVARSIDVHITRLRSKLTPYGKNIVSRSGYGYGWQD